MAVEQSRKSLPLHPACSGERQLYSIQQPQAACSHSGTEILKPLILVNFGASSTSCQPPATVRSFPPAKTGNLIGLLIYLARSH
ncbi:MAG: hypothetical protein KME10_20380 [Plectolyngbya sp. WJT66-NPBG17]|nr:hypothetical protein [Plectolyngbya sp. WJT66-NPBG17]